MRNDVGKVPSPKGRGIQMNIGARRSRGSILLFLHADTFMPRDGLHIIRSLLDEPGVSAGAFELDFEKINPLLRSLLPVHNMMRRVSRTPYGDQGFFIRKGTFQQIGGYPEVQLFEDMGICRKLKKKDLELKISRSKVITSGRRYNSEGAFRGLARNAFIILLYHLGVDPDRLARLYKK
jgi:hypothetical protein